MPPIAQYIFNGVVTGGILALPAVAFSLLWRLLRFPNFAVSTYLTVGAYVALVLNHGVRAPSDLPCPAPPFLPAPAPPSSTAIPFRPLPARRPSPLPTPPTAAPFASETAGPFSWAT